MLVILLKKLVILLNKWLIMLLKNKVFLWASALWFFQKIWNEKEEEMKKRKEQIFKKSMYKCENRFSCADILLIKKINQSSS